MALANLPGSPQILIGPNPWMVEGVPNPVTTITDAANEAVIQIGYVQTSDGGSHTIDTTGSSSIEWKTAAVTFTDVGSTYTVGIAEVDTTAGPAARAVNSSNVITFDVAAVLTGGGGGITANEWITSVPTTGSKTIANGDLVAVCQQFTTRAGSDVVNVQHTSAAAGYNRPTCTVYTGGTYTSASTVPNVLITFADGALGWLHFGEVAVTRAPLGFASNDSPSEYGQLFNLPFATKVYGIYYWSAAAASLSFDLVLYSDPLGTPVAEKTVSIDTNVYSAVTGKRSVVLFPSPYTYTKNTDIAAVIKPTTITNMTAYTRTVPNAAARVTDMWGTSGYGVQRGGGSGAFTNINNSLEHVSVGLIVGAFSDGESAPVEYLLLQPDADSIDGTWTNQAEGTELFSVLDETSTDDADYIKSAGDPVDDTCKIRLSNPTGTPGQPFIVAYRYRKSGPDQIDLTARLLEGTTQIAAWSHTNIISTFVTAEQTLSGAQFDSIGDFTNLFIEFTADRVETFSPLDIVGLKGWYSADEGVTESGGVVSQWDDLSGNSHHLTQATGGAQPTYSVSSFNARHGITFDGSNDVVSTALNAFILGATTDLTAIIVFNSADLTTDADRYAAYLGNGQTVDLTNAASASLFLNHATNGVVGGHCNSAYRAATGVLNTSTNYRLVSRFDGSQHIMYTNNVAGTPVAATTSFTSPGALYIGSGRQSGGATNFGAATIAEILIYDSALSSGDLNALDAYLTSKWGL